MEVKSTLSVRTLSNVAALGLLELRASCARLSGNDGAGYRRCDSFWGVTQRKGSAKIQRRESLGGTGLHADHPGAAGMDIRISKESEVPLRQQLAV